MKKAFLFLAVFALGLAVGFPIGARIGAWQFLLADAQYKASILTTEIRSLKAGHIEPIIGGMEISLNRELAMHGEYIESSLSWLWPDLKSQDDSAIRRAVDYRLKNPFSRPDLAKPENWNPGVDMNSRFVSRVIEGQREQERYLRKVLDYYGDAARNSSRPTSKAETVGRDR
jgi:hypothetical protein